MKNLKWHLNDSYVVFLFILFVKIGFVRSILFDGVRLWDALYIEFPMLVFILGLIEWIFKKGRLWVFFIINAVFSCVFFCEHCVLSIFRIDTNLHFFTDHESSSRSEG